MRWSSAGVSSARCMNGGLCEKTVEPGRDMRRSAFDGEPSCGDGVSGDGVSNLDGGLDARLLLSGLALREDPPNEDKNDRTRNARDVSDLPGMSRLIQSEVRDSPRERTMLAITDLVHTGTEGQLL
jgi:hypothetical protein